MVLIIADNAVKKKSLKPEVQNQMEFILEQLQIVQSLLQSGKILFEYIDLICSFKTHFEEVLALLHEVQSFSFFFPFDNWLHHARLQIEQCT